MAAAPRVRPYKDFLTPLLHRRFAMATAVLGLVCYTEAVFIGQWDSLFWSWFPFGMVAIRTGLLFIPAFMIFILRVGQLHVGLRTSRSGWETFKHFPKQQIVQTVGWYTLSAYLFSEVYIWSVPTTADLNRIKLLPKTDRPILNEKPIYLTSYLLFLAVLQAGFHLYFDYDRIDTKVIKTQPEASSEENTHQIPPPFTQLKAGFFGLASRSAKRVSILALAAPFIYSFDIGVYPFSVRSVAWGFTRFWAKVFWSLSKSSSPPSIRPFHYDVLLRTLYAGFMLVMLWEIGNTAFSVYVAQEPLKNDRPITYESRDPNGSLLTGLRGKKIQTRAFAFWELVYISQRYQGRRKAIFDDIDRNGGPMWSQVLSICLETINGVEQRITKYETPPSLPTADQLANQDAVNSLPRLAKPLKDGLQTSGDLFSSPKLGAADRVREFAKSHGQSPNSNLSPSAKKALSRAEGALLTEEQRKAVSSEGFVGLFKEWIIRFLQIPIGRPFRQEYRQQAVTVVLGEPFGDVGVIVDAIDSLTRLAVCSLKEDQYGNVQRDVKLIIRSLTANITKLEGFVSNLGFHWTDVEKKKECPEIDVVLVTLKGGLRELVTAFGDYSEDLRLSQSEMRLAREASAIPVQSEMVQKNR